MELREPSAKYLVRPGYKQTEVGVIPEDWGCFELGELIDLLTGFPFSSRGYASSGIRLLRGSNIKRGVTDWSDGETVYWPSVSNDLRKYLLEIGDIVVAMDGSLVGRSFAALSEADIPALLLQRVARIRASGNVVQPYLRAWVCSSKFSAHCDLTKTTTAIPHISPGDIRSFKVAIPRDLHEQQAIADALGDADALIESLEHLLAKQRLLRQATMQALLTGERRLPGFEGEWETRQLRDCLVAPPDYGINAPATRYVPSRPAYIRITDISDDGRFVPSPLVSVTHPDAERYRLEDGDLVIARTGASVGKSYCYRPNDGELVFAGFLIRVRPDPSKLDARFLGYVMQTERYWDWLQLMSMRSGQPGINARELSSMALLVPAIGEQTAIATVLSDLDAEIAALEARIAKARQVKQGMMQELLTGRIRLV